MGVETKRQSINMSNDNNVESLQDIHGFKLLNKTKNNNKMASTYRIHTRHSSLNIWSPRSQSSKTWSFLYKPVDLLQRRSHTEGMRTQKLQNGK